MEESVNKIYKQSNNTAMGEYARRKIDGQEVKIGTCNRMYYCRYDQINKINYPYNSDNLIWRIPNPDEDGTLPGDYKYSLLREGVIVPWKLKLDTSKLKREDAAILKQTGTIQLSDKRMGLLVNMKCPHGLPLEQEGNTQCSLAYNGHQNTLYVCGLKNTPKELTVVFTCASCESIWSTSFNDIEPLIESIWMKLRLLRQISEYHYQHNEEPCKFVATVDISNDVNATITPISKERYLVKKNDVTIADAPWHIALNKFVNLLPRTADFDINDIDARMSKLYNIASQAEEIRSNINNI